MFDGDLVLNLNKIFHDISKKICPKTKFLIVYVSNETKIIL